MNNSTHDSKDFTAGDDLHARLIEEAGPAPGSSLGEKPKTSESRQIEARRLSDLMQASKKFSFLRLGDMDLTVLLAYQYGLRGTLPRDDGPINGTVGYGNPGVDMKHGLRMWKAFEQASYVDFHERLWPISKLLPRLRITRPEGLHRNPDAETSYILLTWLEQEFHRYGLGRRIALAGAEARLLEELLKKPAFRTIIYPYWPENGSIHLLPIRNGGRNIDANLDEIKNDLRISIQTLKLDTVFLALGGASKIICYELAEELGVRMFDAGAMMRALTYSGSDGNRACRSTHFPYLFEVPFEIWCDAMERAWPGLAAHERLAKVHAQLILEVQRKEVGWTHASTELDLGQKSRAAFKRGFGIYRDRYQHLFEASPEAKQERISFLHFCGTHGLTQEGRLFMAGFRVKSTVARILGRRNK